MTAGCVSSWSQTAATNASADSTINWAEGQAPSSVNDSARAMMASVAKWRDDITGILTSAGTSTAYTITSNQVQASNTDGFTVQFTPGTTNGGATILSVDSQTAKPLRFYTGIELPAGVLVSGSLYRATYRAATQEWLLHSFDASVYAIPIGAIVDYAGSTVPSSAFALPNGQGISRSVYSSLFSLISTTYGTGDGSTTFNLPDLTGRVTAMKESAATRLTSSFFGGNSTNLGAVGGGESWTLTAANIPTLTSSGSNSISVTSTNTLVDASGSLTDFNTSPSSGLRAPNNTAALRIQTSSGSNNITVTTAGTSGTAHRTVQPTIVLNKIMRIF